ncbi:hypothetical protein GGQ80_000769 [Sphingomonas jinjuensis]|uniref:Uncharacterized protein n=1 Tax=Sphingomonas jinjuensis TaxID=535907 RepID=A0A840F8L1_9SPHN|nr:hypothetical protein [Sphingomonas jinjuensis]MBB4152881.1 hypothetical protein [Sphingomonas jinjuensis]
MGYRPIRTIAQAHEHGLYVEVTCARCGRRALFDPSGFVLLRGIYQADAEIAGFRFRCAGGVGEKPGCGGKGARIRFVSYPPAQPRAPNPKPITPTDAGVPAAVDPAA